MARCDDCPKIVDCQWHHNTNGPLCHNLDRVEAAYTELMALRALFEDDAIWEVKYLEWERQSDGHSAYWSATVAYWSATVEYSCGDYDHEAVSGPLQERLTAVGWIVGSDDQYGSKSGRLYVTLSSEGVE